MKAVQFLLNGKLCREDSAPPSMTVLDWLRTRAHLTGTKEGCAEGDCGACTIVLGRKTEGSLRLQAVNSCLMMLPQLDQCAVFTVEGLAGPDGALHPVQQAMIDTDATQCGFCTPGFVMAMFAFHHGGEPAESAIMHEALAGNLCRCTGYRSIVDACRRIAQGPADRFVAEAPVLAETLSAVPPCADYRSGTQTFLMPRSLDALFAAMEQQPDAILLGGGTDLGLRVSKDREALPAVIALHSVAGAASCHDACGCGRDRRRRHLQRNPAAPRPALSVVRGSGAPHRLAPDPQSRDGRRQSRHRLSDRRQHPVPDRARCQRETDVARGRACDAGEIVHHRLPQDRACRR